MDSFNKLTPAELERLAVLSEELGEAQQAVGKILRHGYESYDPTNTTAVSNREDLEFELGHVAYAINSLTNCKDLSASSIALSSAQKGKKIKQYLHHQE